MRVCQFILFGLVCIRGFAAADLSNNGQNITQDEKHNITVENGNTTGPLQSIEVLKNISNLSATNQTTINYTPSINNTSTNKTANNDLENSFILKENQTTTNRNATSNTSTITKISQDTNTTEKDDKQSPKLISEEGGNQTKHPSFSISPRSGCFKKRSGFRVKFRDRNQDYERDCFEDLEKYLASAACYQAECMDYGVRFFTKDEDQEGQKATMELDIGRGSGSASDCTALSGAESSRVCFRWRDMKWSSWQFTGCVTATVWVRGREVTSPKISCVALRCGEYGWKNKLVLPPTKPPKQSQTVRKDRERKPTFSKPSSNLISNGVSPGIQEKLAGNKNTYGVDTNDRVFDYIITLPTEKPVNQQITVKPFKELETSSNPKPPFSKPNHGIKKESPPKQNNGNKNIPGNKEKEKNHQKPDKGAKSKKENKPGGNSEDIKQKKGNNNKPGNQSPNLKTPNPSGQSFKGKQQQQIVVKSPKGQKQEKANNGKPANKIQHPNAKKETGKLAENKKPINNCKDIKNKNDNKNKLPNKLLHFKTPHTRKEAVEKNKHKPENNNSKINIHKKERNNKTVNKLQNAKRKKPSCVSIDEKQEKQGENPKGQNKNNGNKNKQANKTQHMKKGNQNRKDTAKKPNPKKPGSNAHNILSNKKTEQDITRQLINHVEFINEDDDKIGPETRLMHFSLEEVSDTVPIFVREPNPAYLQEKNLQKLTKP